MDPIIPWLCLALGATALGSALRGGRERARAWRRAAEGAGLTEVKLSRTAGLMRALSGKAGPLQVRLEGYRRSQKAKGTRVIVSGLGHGYGQLSFRSESFGTSLEKQLARQRDVELGDRAFDEKVYLHGSPELACALFDAPTRRLVLLMVQGCFEGPGHPSMVDLGGSVSLHNGALQVEVDEPPRLMVGVRLDDVLPRVLAAARTLMRPPDLVGRLAQNLREDPVAAVRLINLRMLLERHADHPTAQAALTAALGDRSEEIRLRAALALGEPGRQALLEIASSEESDDSRAARAIAGLGEHLSRERATAILRQALRIRRLVSAGACVEALGRRGGPEVVDILATVLVVEKRWLAAAAARALAASGEPTAEGPLIEALRGDSPEVLVAVAEALQSVGTAAAVVRLREASERRADGAFRRACRQAVAAIQARVQGASPGQLSLAAGDAGQVSLVEDGGGRLSLPDKA